MTVSAILLCGGTGSRMGSPLPKVFHQLNGKAAALWPFESLAAAPEIAEIVVVCPEEYRPLFKAEKPLRFAEPGRDRQGSLLNAMKLCSEKSHFYCIHDGARPFLSQQLISLVIEAAVKDGAAAAARPAADTIKMTDSAGYVTATLERSSLWQVQTPQVIRADWLREGAERIEKEKLAVTDDVSIVELLGHPVKLVHNKEWNIKITTAEDMALVRLMAAAAP